MDPHHFLIEEEREHMFEKPLTRSDVGKLNRFVIPKQQAEKYFPLAGELEEKGLLLNFEDESGKEWRFRYSYWISSQSYVLTKGWSSYVKEKRLDAGDIIVFQRCHHDHLLYIGFRRRGDSLSTVAPSRVAAVPNTVMPNMSPPDLSINSMEQNYHLHEGLNENTSSAGPLSSKKVRLFGVNLD